MYTTTIPTDAPLHGSRRFSTRQAAGIAVAAAGLTLGLTLAITDEPSATPARGDATAAVATTVVRPLMPYGSVDAAEHWLFEPSRPPMPYGSPDAAEQWLTDRP